MEKEKVVGYGYILANEKGQIFHTYLRSNRADVWRKLLGQYHTRAERERCKRKDGFRVVPVWIREHKEGKK